MRKVELTATTLITFQQFSNGFLLSSPKLHFRTQLLLLESQARRKNPGFSLGGSCHGWMIWMDGLMLLAVAGLKLKL